MIGGGGCGKTGAVGTHGAVAGGWNGSIGAGWHGAGAEGGISNHRRGGRKPSGRWDGHEDVSRAWCATERESRGREREGRGD
jgi:hypothetical protein